MGKMIYFDNNATTKCIQEVLKEMEPYMKEQFGNPSSIYSFGANIKDKINHARQMVAKLLNAKTNEIGNGGTQEKESFVQYRLLNNMN